DLAAMGARLAIGSNFDGRLRAIVLGLPALAPISDLFISSEVGWKKPAAEFYRHCLAALKLEPGAVLSIGDHLENDAAAPGRLGMPAALMDQAAGVDLRAALRSAAPQG